MSRTTRRTVPLLAALAALAALPLALLVPTAGAAAPVPSAPSAQSASSAGGADDARGSGDRGLRITVLAPREMNGDLRVVVTGPDGFRKVLRRADTFDYPSAREGRYVVRAPAFRMYEQRVEAIRPRQEVVVREGDRTWVHAIYRNPLLCREAGNGGVSAWGAGESGQLGRPGTKDRRPGRVRYLHGITDVAGSGSSVYGRCRNGGTVWAWGADTYGALGNGAKTGNRHFPVKLPGLTGVRQVAGRDRGGLAMKDDGTVWSWGWGDYGQLGNGEPYDASRIAHRAVRVAGISTATDIAAGGNTAYALLADGTVMAWGNGSAGQLGNGANDDSAVPVPATGLSGVTQLAAGHDFVLALLESGAVWAWGNGTQGQLGQGETANSNLPVEVVAGGVREVAAGFAAGYARTTEQLLLSWGSQRHGALGNGVVSNEPVTTPTQVPDLTQVLTVVSYGYAAYAHTLVEGTVAWGAHDRGQLGTDDPVTTGDGGYPTPRVVEWIGPIYSLAAGLRNGYAVV